jgi:cysteine desulfurase/selenocysteine lyase
VANTGKSLESRFIAMAQDLEKEAGRFMAPESYGQWAEVPYQLMAAAAQDTASVSGSAPSAATAASQTDAISEQMAATRPETTEAITAMNQAAAQTANILAAPMKDVYGASATVMSDSYYFMAEAGKGLVTAAAETAMPSGGQSHREHSADIGRIQGLDVLDPNFLGGLANDMFKGMAEYLPEATAWANAGMAALNSYGSADTARAAAASAPMTANVAPSAGPYIKTEAKPSPTSGTARSVFDVESIRRDFPILHRKVHGKPLIWLDNGATTQKPRVVIDRVARFYEHENSNVHRGAHTLAAESTDAYEGARCRVAAFLGAALPEEIIFVRGTTEGINLIANVCGEKFLRPGDEILLTEAEHHANIVPWQFVTQRTGAVIRVAPIDDRGEIILEEFGRRLGPRTKIVSMTHVSNALGTVMPIHEMTRMAKRYGAIVAIDGAQGVPHRKVDVLDIGCDFYVFSGHKLFGPTGIGAVYGRKELWEELSPWQGGGSMIKRVTFEKSTFADLPNKFEAGTGSLASAVGLGSAIDYVTGIGLEAIERYETDLVNYAVNEIRRVKGVRMIGMPRDRAGVISFVLEGMQVPEVGTLLDAEGIAVRAGHHCAQPVLAHFGLESTVRPAFAFYNTKAEADALVEAMHKISFHR